MNQVELTVESSTKTKKDNFCNKLINKSVVIIDTEFGKVETERSSTYYLFTNKQSEKGFKANLDLELFDIVSKSYPFVDDAGEEQVAQLKYLYPKR